MAPKIDKGLVKSEEKKKQKVVEDKTFGLKNKNKSKAVKTYIKGVEAQAKSGKEYQRQVQEKVKKEELKKKEAQKEALLKSLFKGAADINNAKKTEVDITEKQNAKIDLYIDQREQKKVNVVNNDYLKTEIMCKYFLDAAVKKLYGWFWVCPNGGDECAYRHHLPEGYVILDDEPQIENDDDEETLEQIIDRERQALPDEGLTKVTLELFTEWKLKKKTAADKIKVQNTGKALFIANPSLFIDDNQAEQKYEKEEDEEGEEGEGEEQGEGEEREGEEDKKEKGECSQVNKDLFLKNVDLFLDDSLCDF